MKQMLFETRNKADDLLKQSLEIWRQSDQADYLEGIEKDPVFSLLMMALAYQSNELDSEVERLKQEVLDDFARMLVPYEMGHAVPATAVVAASLDDKVPEMTLGEDTVFVLEGEFPFLPLLQTRVLNASVRSVVRLDGRRWKVSIGFGHPVTDLSLFSFVVKGLAFRDLSVSIKGKTLPLVKPWDYADLPFTPSFSTDSLTYNLGQQYNPSMLPLDLFARQNIRIYSFRKFSPQLKLPVEVENLDLVFEFSGISDNFVFDKNALVLNPVLLVNARMKEAVLSEKTPMVRLTGAAGDTGDKDITGRQFLQLVRPMDTQLFNHVELAVRGVSGDRFNQGSLVKLVNSIITKYRSDFYAFQQLKNDVTDSAILQMETALAKLQEVSVADISRNVSGVYLMPLSRSWNKGFSLSVKYLTTAGAAVNERLSGTFTAPSGFRSETVSLGIPIPGTDEIKDTVALDQLLRYYMVTGDRIVTPVDIRLFCLKELLIRYGIGSNLVKDIRVNRRLQQETTGCGYEIVAEIVLVGTSFVKRSMQDKLSSAEILLQKMIEVRCTNIYPVSVSITIDDEE